VKQIFLVSILIACAVTKTSAQVTVGTGDHIFEIGGIISTYLNYRPLKETTTDRDKNKDRFKLRDARFYLEGHIRNTIEYKLQVDLSNIGATSTDPETPALYDAYFKYKGFKPFNVTVGYQKLPYSRSAMTPFSKSVYWQRPEFVRGDLFSQRDIGITLDKSFWNQRINAYAGVYTGTGELFYTGDNDVSGAFEYIGRVDVSYPSRFRYQDFDSKNTPIPMISAGVNGRYSKRNLPDGKNFIDGETGAYGLKVVDGEKYVLGADAAFQFKGFSAQFEIHQIKGTPRNEKDPLLRGLPKELSQGFFKAGGLYGQAAYFISPIHSVISIRYEQLDLNDLESGRSERMGGALAYVFNGSRSMIKAQYFHILKEDKMDPLDWKEQFRVGVQFAFE
jgi:hypothetical protein